MKRVSFLIIILCLVSPFVCYGGTTAYRLGSANLTLYINKEDFDFVFENGNVSNINPDFDFEYMLNVTEDEYLEAMKNADLCFDAFNLEDLSEIYVHVDENDESNYIYDINNYNEKEFYDMVNEGDLKSIFNENGFSNVETSIQRINGSIYLIITGKSDDIFSTSYFTIKNGKFISIALNTQNESTYEKYNDILTDIVNSVEFDSITPVTTPQNSTLTSDIGKNDLTAIAGVVIGAIAILFYIIIKSNKSSKRGMDTTSDRNLYGVNIENESQNETNSSNKDFLWTRNWNLSRFDSYMQENPSLFDDSNND